MESSLSPLARTGPQRANVVDVGSARPSASTSTMLIWTDAKSFAVMRRSADRRQLHTARRLTNALVAAHLRGT